MKKILFQAALIFLFISKNVYSQNGQYNFYALSSGLNGRPSCMAVYNGALFIGGTFSNAGGITAKNIVKYDGLTWSSVGADFSSPATGFYSIITSMIVYNGELYVGGNFGYSGIAYLAKWNGSSWSSVGTGINGTVSAMEVYNGELYVAGNIINAGGITVNNIAKWNGSTWSSVGMGLNNPALDLKVYNGHLIATGAFTNAGGGYIAKWDGSSWSGLGLGLDNYGTSMEVLNGELFVGGYFTLAGGNVANYIAKWNGSSWATIGAGVNGFVESMAVFKSELYVGGNFTSAGGISASKIVKLVGNNWSTVGTGVVSTAYSIQAYQGELYVGGEFLQAGGVLVNRIVRIKKITYEPSLQCTNLQFSQTGINSIQLFWNKGNGNRSLVVVREVGQNQINPIDTMSYSANTVYGAGQNIGNNNYVLYNAMGNVINVTNLNAQTEYIFSVYSFNDSSVLGCANYMMNPLIGNRFTLSSEPSVQASYNSTTSRTENSLTISLNPGNGVRRIVLARKGQSVNGGPSDGSSYNTSSTYGLGSQIGTGNFVVYDGTDNSFTVNGLEVRTKYYFTVFEYNRLSGVLATSNYLSWGSSNIVQSTLHNNPTIQCSNMQFVATDSNSLSLSWVKGDGSKSLVMARETGSIPAVPTDGLNYVANAAFALGQNIANDNYVVYASAGNSLIVNNLNPQTEYHFYAVSYNDSNINGFTNYLTLNPLTTSKYTLSVEPSVQSIYTATTNRTETSLAINLTPGNGGKRIVLARKGGSVNASPADATSYVASASFGSGAQIGIGNYVVYNGTGNSFSVSGLEAQTKYYFAVFEYNSSGVAATTNYLHISALNFSSTTINQSPTVQSSNLQFNNISDTTMGLTWVKGNGTKSIVIARAGAAVSVNPVDTTTYTSNATFATGQHFGFGTYVVYTGTGNNVNITNLNPQTQYYFSVFEYNDSTVSGYANYLTTAPLMSNHYTLAAEPTQQVNTVSTSARTETSISLTLSPGNGNSRIVLARKGSPVNEFPIDGTGYTASSIFGSGSQLGAGNFVVYSNTGNTVAVSGLEAQATYYFAVYEYNALSGIAATNNYLTTAAFTYHDATIHKSPSVQVANLQFNAITDSTISLSWVKGDGAKSMVIARAGAAVSASPVDTTAYAANAAFGLGQELGNSNFVVYSGAANSVTLTHLDTLTTYHFRIYTFNDSTAGGYENYLNTSPAAGSQSTMAAEPSAQASAIVWEEITMASIRFKLNKGNGNHRIVIMRENLPVSKMPADGQQYAAGVNLGDNNKVVYAGTDSTFQVNALNPETMYHFAVFEYNIGSAPQLYNYLLSNPLRAEHLTLNTEPAQQPTNLLFSNVSGNSMSLSWDNGDGERRILFARTASVAVAPVDGTQYHASDTMGNGTNLGLNTFVIYSGSGNAVDISNMQANTTYHFALYEYNGSNGSNNYLNNGNPLRGNKSTLIAEPNTPASNLTLSAITNGITTVNWTKGNGSNRLAIVRQGTPINQLPVDGTPGYTANNSFGQGTDLGGGNFICYSGNGNTFNLQGLDPANLYYLTIIEYNGSGTGANYNTTAFPIADNLPAEPSTAASSLSFNSVNVNAMKLHWIKGNGSARLVIAKEGTAVDRLPVDGTVYVANNQFGTGADLGFGNYVVYNGNSDTLSLTGLTTNTTYHLAVIEFNKDVVGPANYLTTQVLTGSANTLSVGINHTLESQFVIYPNPANEILYVSNVPQGAELSIVDVTGKVLFSSIHSGGEAVINTSAIADGLYLIRIRQEGNILNKKLIIHR